jgi:hypothetical protein
VSPEEFTAAIRHFAATWMADPINDLPFGEAAAAEMLRLLEGHAVIDGQVVTIEHAYGRELGQFPRPLWLTASGVVRKFGKPTEPPGAPPEDGAMPLYRVGG